MICQTLTFSQQMQWSFTLCCLCWSWCRGMAMLRVTRHSHESKSPSHVLVTISFISLSQLYLNMFVVRYICLYLTFSLLKMVCKHHCCKADHQENISCALASSYIPFLPHFWHSESDWGLLLMTASSFRLKFALRSGVVAITSLWALSGFIILQRVAHQ